MLLDFADAAQVNVYTLGQVYLKLIKRIKMDMLPVIGGLLPYEPQDLDAPGSSLCLTILLLLSCPYLLLCPMACA